MTFTSYTFVERQTQVKAKLYESLTLLYDWIEKEDYQGYDTFDGLSSKVLRPLTFDNKLLNIALQQGVRRFPINLRPLLAVPRSRSTKAMGFFAKGFIRLYNSTGEVRWRQKAESALQWLVENRSEGYSGACWGNHFDYQSRTGFAPKGSPSVVWTSLIGHAFLDAYDEFGERTFLDVAVSSCGHILADLPAFPEGDGICIGYFPHQDSMVHNANTLGASLLARVYRHTGAEAYRVRAEKAIRYTANAQRSDSSWFYGEAGNLHWIDNFHTAYVLDCFKCYATYTGDKQFCQRMMDGYCYWRKTFFSSDGTPHYYNNKQLPLDIQCCSQAIDTLVFFKDLDPGSIDLACRVAQWTIRNMQDRSGYFYYRRYTPWLTNKTPTLHWGQATMFIDLTGLYQSL